MCKQNFTCACIIVLCCSTSIASHPTAKQSAYTVDELYPTHLIPKQKENKETKAKEKDSLFKEFHIHFKDFGIRSSYGWFAPIGSGESGGTGNQNYHIINDIKFTKKFHIITNESEADDPMFVRIKNRATNPENLWLIKGVQFSYLFYQQPRLSFRFLTAFDHFHLRSGGCSAFGCTSNSDNIFNNSGLPVEKNFMGYNEKLMVTYKLYSNLSLNGFIDYNILPSNIAGGRFYGQTFNIGIKVNWLLYNRFKLEGELKMPFGSGNNTFNNTLTYSKVPIYHAGLAYLVNPRVKFLAELTNQFGATPSTDNLTIPSADKMGYHVAAILNLHAPDSPDVSMSLRQAGIAMGGITTGTAYLPPADDLVLSVNADSQFNWFGSFAYSASNDLQVQYSRGQYRGVPMTSAMNRTYLGGEKNDSERLGGKAILFHQVRGDWISYAGRITLGRNKDPGSYQGYVFAEGIITREVTPTIAVSIDPKMVWSGVKTVLGSGFGLNIQLNQQLQLIPELNINVSRLKYSNATLGLRWIPNQYTHTDLYVSNAAGIQDYGQLARSEGLRVGLEVSGTISC